MVHLVFIVCLDMMYWRVRRAVAAGVHYQAECRLPTRQHDTEHPFSSDLMHSIAISYIDAS